MLSDANIVRVKITIRDNSMKKSLIAISVASILLSACGSEKNTQSEQQQPKQVETAKAEATATGKAELGTFGVDLTARNLEIKPGDDFFMYASGDWYDNYQMPADKTRFGAFTALAERSEKQVKEIIDDVTSRTDLNADEKMVADFYNSFMDTETINKLGITPIQSTLDEIASVKSVDDLTKLFGQSWLKGTSSPIGGGMWFNRLDPDKYEMSVGAGGLGMPDRSYYLETSERFEKTRAAYVAHVAEMLAFAGVEDAQAKANNILALETKIAQGHWPREKRRNRDLTLNQIKREELAKEYPGFNWDVYFAQTQYQVPQFEIFLNLSQLKP